MDRDLTEKEQFAAANSIQEPATSDEHATSDDYSTSGEHSTGDEPRLSSYRIADENDEETATTDLAQQPVDKLNGKPLSNNAMIEEGGDNSNEISSNTPIEGLDFNYEALEDESEDSEDEEYRQVSSAEDESEEFESEEDASEEESKPRRRQRHGGLRLPVPSKKRGATTQSRRKSSKSGPPAKRSRHSYKSRAEYDDDTDQSELDFGGDDNSDDEGEGGCEYVPRGTSSRPRV